MSAIIPFESKSLPAFLQKAAPQVNNDLTANVGAGFPVMSIKGKSWTITRGGEKTMVTREVDGETIPAPSIEVVILRANKNFSKTWYAKAFVEGTDAKPDCYSNNGDAPEADSENPQAKTCAACPKNQWGSKISDDGKKLKACQDVRRVAIAAPDHLNDPMLLRIPPATLKLLAEYGQMLSKRGVPYNAVVTKMKFDPDLATPKILFEPKGFLTEEQFTEASEAANSDLVEQIIGFGDITPEDTHEAQAEAPKAESKPKAEKPKAAKGVVTEAEIGEVVAPKAEKPKAEAKKPVVAEVAVDADLDALLNSLDD